VSGTLVDHPNALTRCPICDERNTADSAVCGGCGAVMHDECYYGRVLTLDEWREYMRLVHDGPEVYAGAAVRCPACRGAA
jgi:hypothetical protein